MDVWRGKSSHHASQVVYWALKSPALVQGAIDVLPINCHNSFCCFARRCSEANVGPAPVEFFVAHPCCV